MLLLKGVVHADVNLCVVFVFSAAVCGRTAALAARNLFAHRIKLSQRLHKDIQTAVVIVSTGIDRVPRHGVGAQTIVDTAFDFCMSVGITPLEAHSIESRSLEEQFDPLRSDLPEIDVLSVIIAFVNLIDLYGVNLVFEIRIENTRCHRSSLTELHS